MMILRLNKWILMVCCLAAFGMPAIAGKPPGGGGTTPTLTVTVSASTIAEGQTATGTVSRVNASLTSAVLVTLTSNVAGVIDATEATVDASVTIPIGETNAAFTVTGVNDGTGDGAKTVTITAAATGFKSGSVNVTAATPELPPVRYRVQFIPTPANAHCQDVNDSHETVGWFTQTTNGRDINTGFYYNAATREYRTATEMLPTLTGTQFIGINKQGSIVGSLADSNGIRSGILIYRSATSPSGWSHEVVPGPDNAYEYYPRDISDSGDVVGVYWRLNENGTQGLADAFAYNPGLPLETDLLAPTPFGLADAHLYSIQVSNQGRGLAVDNNTGDGWWFDFLTNSVDPVVVPDPYYIIVTGLVTHSLSNDGQLAVARIASTTKVRGGYTYTYTPGIVQDGLLRWQGDFEGRTFFVNSVVDGNPVGDAVGWSNGFQTQWLQHADWGKLDMENMLVFEFPEDQVRWLLYDHFATQMSDRDSTGFGMVVGDNSNSNELFVLLPEIVP